MALIHTLSISVFSVKFILLSYYHILKGVAIFGLVLFAWSCFVSPLLMDWLDQHIFLNEFHVDVLVFFVFLP